MASFQFFINFETSIVELHQISTKNMFWHEKFISGGLLQRLGFNSVHALTNFHQKKNAAALY